jgi:hypothetical protein
MVETVSVCPTDTVTCHRLSSLRAPQNAKIRQQAADLIARIAVVMKACDEEKLLGHLGVVLYEYLGEEYPEVLGSILAALKVLQGLQIKP